MHSSLDNTEVDILSDMVEGRRKTGLHSFFVGIGSYIISVILGAIISLVFSFPLMDIVIGILLYFFVFRKHGVSAGPYFVGFFFLVILVFILLGSLILLLTAIFLGGFLP